MIEKTKPLCMEGVKVLSDCFESQEEFYHLLKEYTAGNTDVSFNFRKSRQPSRRKFSNFVVIDAYSLGTGTTGFIIDTLCRLWSEHIKNPNESDANIVIYLKDQSQLVIPTSVSRENIHKYGQFIEYLSNLESIALND